MKPIALVVALVGMCLRLQAARAQPVLPPRPADASTSPLQRALEQGWRLERDGPLIAIAPGNTLPREQLRRLLHPDAATRRNPLPDPPSPDASLVDVAAYYGRTFIRCGTITAFAPDEMVIINTHPRAVNPFLGLPDFMRLFVLMDSLSQAQLDKLGGEQGLGMGDLQPAQQELFLSVLPEPFSLQPYHIQDGMRQNDARDITLTPDQRAQVRLRMQRTVTLGFNSATRDDAFITLNNGRIRRDGEKGYSLESRLVFVGGREDMGADLTLTQPNQLKPGDLRFDLAALDPAISLAPEADAPLKIRSLLQRIGGRCGLELHADARVADQPVWTAGRSARAGDALRALCLAVTGTFRKVGAAYVLTDDLQGIGARRALLREWRRDVGARVSALSDHAWRRFIGGKPESFIHYADPGSLPLPADAMNALPTSWSGEPYHGREVSVSDLTPDWQQIVRQQAQLANADQPAGGASYTVKTDRVWLSSSVERVFLVPGYGLVNGDVGGGSSRSMVTGQKGGPLQPITTVKRPAAPSAWSEGETVRALEAAPASSQEAAALAAVAKRHGFDQLWIDLPPRDAAAVMAGAVAAGKQHGVTIWAVHSLLFQSPANASPLVDTAVTGETAAAVLRRRSTAPRPLYGLLLGPDTLPLGQWMRIDTPEGRMAVKSRAMSVAALPGIAGLVLRNAVAPGYEETGKARNAIEPDTWDFGYSTERRLATLRSEGADPPDISDPLDPISQVTRLPNFPEEQYNLNFPLPVDLRTQRSSWKTRRYDENSTFVKDMFGALGAKPLVIEDGWSSPRFQPAWLVRWEEAGRYTLPAEESSRPQQHDNYRGAGLKALRRIGHANWLRTDALRFADGKPADDPVALAADVMTEARRVAGKAEGIVVDLTDVPANQIDEKLRNFPARH